MISQWSRPALSVGLALLLFAPVSLFAASKDVAKVGGIAITRFEVNREAQRMLPMQVSFHGGVSSEKVKEVQEKALEKLIERAYKVQYALSHEISVDNAAVDKRLETVRSRFKTPQEFEKALGGEGVKAFRASLYRDLLAEKAEEAAVGGQAKVSDEEVSKYYQEKKATYKRPKQFKASHILVKVDPSANAGERAALKKKADDLAAKAKAGEDFYNLAYYNSDDRSKYVGGDIGYFHEGQTVKEFEDAVKKMKPGEISGPVQSMYGFHIIKLVEANEARQLAFDEVKDKIRQKLEDQKRSALYEEWMKGLKEKYPVERFESK